MDKITRLLLLYSKLTQGEGIHKVSFCAETDTNARSFDRDIEDIRLYLAERHQNQELEYDRRENVYFLTNCQRQELEAMEYYFVERMLLDSGVLRKDEADGLLSHLASNTENVRQILSHEQYHIAQYKGPYHNKAILKMHGDLVTVIRKKRVITLQYEKATGEFTECTVIPCDLHFDLGYMYLIAYKTEGQNQYPAYFRLDRIHSFKIVCTQTSEEKAMVEQYHTKYEEGLIQMYGGEFIKIDLKCSRKFVSYVMDQFKNARVIQESEEDTIIRVSAFEEGFMKWILGQPSDMVIVEKPEILKIKIAEKAQKLYKKYMEESNDGKEKTISA